MHDLLFCGIDPGLSGAIGFVRADGSFASVHDMPVLTTTTGRKQVDFSGLAAILREHHPAFVLVERVGARPGEGAVGGFAFGMTYGGILSMLATMALPHDVVQPASWKRKAGIPPGADKQASIQTTLRLLPTAASYLTRKKDDGRAEALLLAVQAWERRRE
jgi:Holliday junction resolvasome RuvABC endonuclease subunit